MARGSSRKSPAPLSPDYANRNPFVGLPADFPATHSRFPVVPVERYGELSFVPPVGENVLPEGSQKKVMTEAELEAWRQSMREVFSHSDSRSLKR